MQVRKFEMLVLLLLLLLPVAALLSAPDGSWSREELQHLRELSLASLEPLPPDPSNRVADDPRAAALGQRLFFDERFSSNGKVACATCHLPDKAFQDGTPLAKGVGTTDRRTMSVIGTARSPWQFWDGRKDSQWSQALGPLESAVEHGGDRTQYAHLAAAHYAAEYEAIFGKLPDLQALPKHAGPVPDEKARAAWEALPASDRDRVSTVFANLGKAIAAYERKLEPGPTRFDAYVDGGAKGTQLSRDEIAGLKLFVGKAQCIQCHSGPLLTNHEFHNTGVPAARGLPEDRGRLAGAKQVVQDEFNCLSRHSDAKPGQCGEIRFLESNPHQLRQFRVPSLRGVAERAPYMHAGQFATLREVLEHYNRAPAAPAGHSELKPLNLQERELAQLEAFLRTLSGPVNAEAKWLRAP
jgi:cytochrome c peroxidase